MEKLKQVLERYLNNQITIKNLNDYFMFAVPFYNAEVESLRLHADLTVEHELTEQDLLDELITEAELKQEIRLFLENL